MKSIKDTQFVFYLLTFLFWFSMALPLALIILIIQSRGPSLFQVSLLFGIHSLTVLLLELPTGSLADLIGRKRVTVWASVLMIVGFGLFFVSFSYPLLLFGGVVYGASRALASGAIDAWFVDEVQVLDPHIDLQPLLAKSGVVTLLGLAAGTLFGGVLPTWASFLPPEGSAILTPFTSTLLLSLIVQLLRLGLVMSLMQETRMFDGSLTWRDTVATVPGFVRDAVQMSRGSQLIRWLLLTTFAAGFVMFSLENFWQPHFEALLGGSEGNSVTFGIIMAGNFLLGAIGNMVSIPLAQWLNGRLGLLAGLFELVRGVLLLLLVVQSGVVPAVAFFWLTYFGMGVAVSPVGTMLNQAISAERRSSMLSIHSMVSYIGVFVGSIVLGVLAERISIKAAWTVAGCVLLLLLLPYWRVDRLYSEKYLNAKFETEREGAKAAQSEETQPQTV